MIRWILAAVIAAATLYIAIAPAKAGDPMTMMMVQAGSGMMNNMMRMQQRRSKCRRPYIVERGRCVMPHYYQRGRYIGAPMRYAAPYRSGAGPYYGRSGARSGYGQQDQDDRSESKHVTDPKVMEAHRRPVSEVCRGPRGEALHGDVKVNVERGGVATYPCP